MARKSGGSGSNTPQLAHLIPEQIKIGIQKLERRLEHLKNFDPATIETRDNPRITALEADVDYGLVSVYGPNSVQYLRYCQAATIDTASINLMGSTPLHEVREGLKRGKADAIALLEQAVSSLKEELELQGAGMAAPEPDSDQEATAPGRNVFGCGSLSPSE